MTLNDLLTKKDLEDFKKELFDLLSSLNEKPTSDQQKWLKTVDVKKMLNVSSGTLNNLRLNGVLPYNKVGGLYYYRQEDVEKMLNGPEKKRSKKKH
jgi:hypothetical protein